MSDLDELKKKLKLKKARQKLADDVAKQMETADKHLSKVTVNSHDRTKRDPVKLKRWKCPGCNRTFEVYDIPLRECNECVTGRRPRS